MKATNANEKSQLSSLHYEEVRNTGKESILFIHGIGASQWTWWQQLPVFSENYQIITVDLPGHGKSVSTPWVSLNNTTKLIAEQIIKDRIVHVVGLSLGGHVALELAKHYPKNIFSLFTSGITVKPMQFQFFLKLQSWFVQRSQQNNQHLNKLAREYYQLPENKIDEFTTNYQLLTRDTYETIFKELMQFRLDQSYKMIKKPSLFVAGEKESQNILETIKIAPTILPNAKGKIIPNALHAWPVQDPVQFNQVLKEWLLQQ